MFCRHTASNCTQNSIEIVLYVVHGGQATPSANNKLVITWIIRAYHGRHYVLQTVGFMPWHLAIQEHSFSANICPDAWLCWKHLVCDNLYAQITREHTKCDQNSGEIVAACSQDSVCALQCMDVCTMRTCTMWSFLAHVLMHVVKNASKACCDTSLLLSKSRVLTEHTCKCIRIHLFVHVGAMCACMHIPPTLSNACEKHVFVFIIPTKRNKRAMCLHA